MIPDTVLTWLFFIIGGCLFFFWFKLRIRSMLISMQLDGVNKRRNQIQARWKDQNVSIAKDVVALNIKEEELIKEHQDDVIPMIFSLLGGIAMIVFGMARVLR